MSQSLRDDGESPAGLRIMRPVVISLLCCGPGEVVVANEVLDGTNVMGQLLGEG